MVRGQNTKPFCSICKPKILSLQELCIKNALESTLFGDEKAKKKLGWGLAYECTPAAKSCHTPMFGSD